MKRILLLFTILFFAYNTNAQSVKKTELKKEFIQLAILKTGKIFTNGKKTNLKELDATFKFLKQKKGVIHFYQSPSVKKSFLKTNIEVLKLITKHKLSIKQFKDKNFTKELLE